jgi:hypothetical protein
MWLPAGALAATRHVDPPSYSFACLMPISMPDPAPVA